MLALGLATLLHLAPPTDTTTNTAPPAEPGAYALSAVRAAGPITVDGALDDAGWADATRVSGFHEIFPANGRPASEDTEVWIAYDDRHLYVAFRAEAPPGAVRATLGQRDKVMEDDLLFVMIDPRGTDEWAYAFGANPLGVQFDARAPGLEMDPKLDLVYESAGRVTGEGYVVEMAIPFSSVQGEPGARPWKINFGRAHPRNTRFLSSWAPILESNPCVLCQSGTISGFEGVSSSASWSLLPALVAQQSSARAGAGAPLEHGGAGAEPSLGASYRTSGGWSLEGTYNPDFSQVESDVAQIDVNSALALSYPEKRPFFQEGADLFATPLNTVYTRAINAPRGAMKVRGEVGGWQVGYLGAHDETSPYFVPLRERTLVGEAGTSLSHVLRARRSLGAGSFFGAMLTDRSYAAGARGTTFGIDGAQRFGTVYELAYQLVGSRTEEADEGIFGRVDHTFTHRGRTHTAAQDGEEFTGYGGRLALKRAEGRTQLAASYGFATPTLQAANGFLRRNDYHDVELSVRRSFRPEGGIVDDVSPGMEVGREWAYGGEGQRSYVEPSLLMMLKGQTVMGLFYYRADEVYRRVRFEGLDKGTFFLQSNFSDRVGMGVQAKYGDDIVRLAGAPVSGRELVLSGSLTLRPTQQLVLKPRFAFARMAEAASGDEVYRGSISRLDAGYQVTRELSVRLTGQYNSFRDRFELDPLVTYQVSPFSMVYAGSTHDLLPGTDGEQWSLSERQLFVKFQYQFRR